MNKTRFNLDVTAERSGAVEMAESAVEMMMVMIPMKSSLMTVTMAMRSPLREGISPVDFCLPGSFSLCGFPPRSGDGIFLCSLSCLGFSGG